MVAVHKVCNTILEKLGIQLIQLRDLLEVITGFGQVGFLNCMGALSRTHTSILSPSHCALDYINHKETLGSHGPLH